MKTTIYTIGHSNHELEHFIDLLKSNKIELLVDVRSSPYSKYVPYFNSKTLIKTLKDKGIDYLYLGDKIGGKPKDKKYYIEGKVNYPLIEKGEQYKEGIRELIDVSKGKKTVLMCTEEDPHKCHRHMLITPTLLKKGFEVIHIMGNGEFKREGKEGQCTLDSFG